MTIDKRTYMADPGQMQAVEVTVPNGALPGQVLKVVVPGHRRMLFAQVNE
jgi:hypothetical protein